VATHIPIVFYLTDIENVNGPRTCLTTHPLSAPTSEIFIPFCSDEGRNLGTFQRALLYRKAGSAGKKIV